MMQLKGDFRRMHCILISKGIQCRREDVRKMVCDKGSEDVQLRKQISLRRGKYTSPGPNFVWHIDGHNKLKPCSFRIYSAINGFSRRVLWLEVSTYNRSYCKILSRTSQTKWSTSKC